MSNPQSLPLGHVMLDVAGTSLGPDDVRRLTHPAVGAVILFARNYTDPAQLQALTRDIRALRTPELLIAVDHEGGRVQRFRSGFCALPPMRRLGQLWAQDREQARRAARDVGSVMAYELSAHGVDFSFAPVLDLDYGNSTVIGDRSFGRDPEAVTELAGALIDGLHARGMIAVGKHFPGHGYCAADSHVALPRDARSLAQIEADDLLPFRALLRDRLDAIMPAHVVYEQVDARTAGFSPLWLRDILRSRYGFKGVIFSDDLSMEGASVAGGVVQRAQAALSAGCDMVLVCNKPASADELLAGSTGLPAADWAGRIEALRARPAASDRAALATAEPYLAALRGVSALV